MAKFDDASWHWGADNFPADVPEENGATHIGMFVTWTIERGLFADPDLTPEEVEAVHAATSVRPLVRALALSRGPTWPISPAEATTSGRQTSG